MSKKIKIQKESSLFKRGFRVLIYVSLVLAFVYGKYYGEAGFEKKFLIDFPEYSEIEKVNEFQYKLFQNNKELDFLFVGSEQGYGGPLTAGIQLDSNLNIQTVHILDEKETFGYLKKVIRKGFFKQYSDKKINVDIQINSGIDAVSGCTVSCVAFANAINKAAIEACKKSNLSYSIPEKLWQFGKNEMLVILVIAIGILAFYLKKKWLRYISLTTGFIVIGFIVNASISIANSGRLFLAYFPDPRDHIIWWLLMSFFIGFSLFAAKNIYCTTVCPFHATQIALSKLSGLKLRISPAFQKLAKPITGFLLWFSLIMIFISVNPTLGSYEPFALLFSLEGVGIQWYLLPAALFGALLVPDYYCHFFCPVGRMHKWLASVNRRVVSLITQKANR